MKTQSRIKTLKKPIRIALVTDEMDNEDGALHLLVDLGYYVYQELLDTDLFAIVSPRPLTYGYYKRYLLWEDEKDYQLDWWNEQTDYNSKLNEELLLYFE